MHSATMSFRRPSARNVHQGVSNWNQHSWSVPQGLSGLLGWGSVEGLKMIEMISVFFGDVLWWLCYFSWMPKLSITIWPWMDVVVCSDSCFTFWVFAWISVQFPFPFSLFWRGGRRAFGAPKESPRTWIPLECSQRELFEPRKSLDHHGSWNVMMDHWTDESLMDHESWWIPDHIADCWCIYYV